MNMGKPGENHFHDVMAINDSHWSGQHSYLGTTRMYPTLPPHARGL